MIGVAPRLAGLGAEEFEALWRGRHAELVIALGPTRYVQHHQLPLLPDPGFDVLAELDFADLDALRAAFRSDAYRLGVAPDEELLVDRARQFGVRADIESDAAGDPPVALVTLHRAPPSEPPPPRTRRLRALPGQPVDVVAMDVTGFDLPEQALAAAAAEPAPAGASRLVSRPHRVV